MVVTLDAIGRKANMRKMWQWRAIDPYCDIGESTSVKSSTCGAQATMPTYRLIVQRTDPSVAASHWGTHRQIRRAATNGQHSNFCL
jgi:hypothetical protein